MGSGWGWARGNLILGTAGFLGTARLLGLAGLLLRVPLGRRPRPLEETRLERDTVTVGLWGTLRHQPQGSHIISPPEIPVASLQ